MQKRKKSRPLTGINKAIAIACGVTDKNSPSEARDIMDDTRKNAKELLASLGMKEGPNSPIGADPEHQYTAFHLCESMDENDYFKEIRTMMMGYWMSNRRVYRLGDDAVDFVENRFPIDHLIVPVHTVLRKLAATPLYIEFTGKKYPKLGAFLTLITPVHKTVNNGSQKPLLLAIRVDGISRMFGYGSMDGPVNDLLSQADQEEHAQCVMLKALMYISYVSETIDYMDVMIQKDMPLTTCYEILAHPCPDSIPDLSSPMGALEGGLAFFFGYLSRAHMLASFRDEVARLSQDPAPDEKTRNKMVLRSMVIDWEESRTIYTYDMKTMERVVDKYMHSLLLGGISSDLMQYFPHKTVVLCNTDKCDIILVSPCQTDDGEPGIALFSVGDGAALCIVNARLPILVKYWAERNANRAVADTYLSTLCILYHMLSIFREKHQNLLIKSVLAMNAGREEGLIPVTDRKERADKESFPGFRIGSEVQETPITKVFSVSSQAVRRIPQKELVQKHGWKVVPHIRRRHPHQYWVGRGLERHLEVRWIEEMKINSSDKVPITSTVAHPIR